MHALRSDQQQINEAHTTDQFVKKSGKDGPLRPGNDPFILLELDQIIFSERLDRASLQE